MKKTTKIIGIILIMLLALFGNCKVNATDSIQQNYDVKFETVGITTISADNINPDTSMNTLIAKAFGVVMYICSAIAVIVIIIKGVKFMSAAPEAKAEIKKQMIAIAIGAALIFSTGKIIEIVASTGRSIIG